MSDRPLKQKRLLFVDDDREFLEAIRQVFSGLSQGGWIVQTADSHAQALKLLQRDRPDVMVLDMRMPVIDGLQFLRLIAQSHPGQTVVIWTGHPNAEDRRTCLEAGASLFLEKLMTPEGFAAVYAALDTLAGTASNEGFRGMMRRVGLQEVLQLECLGRKSSILEVFAGRVQGRIFILEGAIIHAEAGSLQGEVALYGLLGLRGGEFNLKPFAEPSRRTIESHYEFLLMEAARLSDEGSQPFGAEISAGIAREPLSSGTPPAAWVLPSGTVEIEELLLCSGAGEVLQREGCKDLESRLALFAQFAHQGTQLAALLRSGPLDRVEMRVPRGRVVCLVQPDLRLYLRSVVMEGKPA
jgi:CheY-like chemotaxis protein